jgi:prepilin-type N-terminal cleavage/methylation domain-containing protein
MKLSAAQRTAGFTLSELVVASALGCILLAATAASSVSLQKSFNAIDSFFGAEVQQIRIVDYMTRDVKRGLSVVTSSDLQHVTITVPKYLIQEGDPEAASNPALIGTPRTPTIAMGSGGLQVNYASNVDTVVYTINGNTVSRSENGVVTNIAVSASQLLPVTTDVQLANTEYSQTQVTFLPIFSGSNAAILKKATSVYSTAYLRNKRRG